MTGGWIGSIQKMDVQVMIPRACSSRAESKEGVHIERRGYMPIAYLYSIGFECKKDCASRCIISLTILRVLTQGLSRSFQQVPRHVEVTEVSICLKVTIGFCCTFPFPIELLLQRRDPLLCSLRYHINKSSDVPKLKTRLSL